MVSTDASLINDLIEAVGSEAVRTDPDELVTVNRDRTGRFLGEAAVLVRPSSTRAVQAVVATCRRHRIALVPVGGNTGLVGGTAAPPGAVALSTSRLGAITDVDAVAGQLTAGAGVSLAQVQAAAGRIGWRYPVDFGARDVRDGGRHGRHRRGWHPCAALRHDSPAHRRRRSGAGHRER